MTSKVLLGAVVDKVPILLQINSAISRRLAVLRVSKLSNLPCGGNLVTPLFVLSVPGSTRSFTQKSAAFPVRTAR